MENIGEDAEIFEGISMKDLRKTASSFMRHMRLQGFIFDKEEVEAEIFLVAAKAIKTFNKGNTKFSTYLYTAIVNRIWKIKREIIETSKLKRFEIDTVSGVVTDSRWPTQLTVLPDAESLINPEEIAIAKDLFCKTIKPMKESWQSIICDILAPSDMVIACNNDKTIARKNRNCSHESVALAHGTSVVRVRKINSIFHKKLSKMITDNY